MLFDAITVRSRFLSTGRSDSAIPSRFVYRELSVLAVFRPRWFFSRRSIRAEIIEIKNKREIVVETEFRKGGRLSHGWSRFDNEVAVKMNGATIYTRIRYFAFSLCSPSSK